MARSDYRVDYRVCPCTKSGRHVPAAGYDPEMPTDHFTIQCEACSQTTGYPLPDYDDIEWD
jgi:hypothetical protein